jgi:hypothetical protein
MRPSGQTTNRRQRYLGYDDQHFTEEEVIRGGRILWLLKYPKEIQLLAVEITADCDRPREFKEHRLSHENLAGRLAEPDNPAARSLGIPRTAIIDRGPAPTLYRRDKVSSILLYISVCQCAHRNRFSDTPLHISSSDHNRYGRFPDDES